MRAVWSQQGGSELGPWGQVTLGAHLGPAGQNETKDRRVCDASTASFTHSGGGLVTPVPTAHPEQRDGNGTHSTLHRDKLCLWSPGSLTAAATNSGPCRDPGGLAWVGLGSVSPVGVKGQSDWKAAGSVCGDHQVIAAFGVTEAPFLEARRPPPPATRPRVGRRGGWPWPGPAAAPSLDELHVVGGKHAEVAVWPVAAPPALVDHLDACDEVLRVKGDLGVISCKVSPDAAWGPWGPSTSPSPSRGCPGGRAPSTPHYGWAPGPALQQQAHQLLPRLPARSPLVSPPGSLLSSLQSAAGAPDPACEQPGVAGGAPHTCLVVIQGPGAQPLPGQPQVAIRVLSAGVLLRHLRKGVKYVWGPGGLGREEGGPRAGVPTGTVVLDRHHTGCWLQL